MTTRIVKTQAELDAALSDDSVTTIDIRSERGVWLHVGDSATVQASDSATVRAWGSATVEASDSATVQASDSATVQASDSATVEASDSATVRASDSATVRAWGSATVRASGSATVRASGSATVQASGSATVEAGSHTAVHLHSGRATVQGGVLIDHTAVNLTDARAWADYHGATTDDDQAIVYKAVRDDLRSSRGFAYPLGETVACDDFADVDECGAGLHFSPTPAQAGEHDRSATRYLECHVRLDELRPITGNGTPKCKAPRATVVREVDAHARPLAAAAAA